MSAALRGYKWTNIDARSWHDEKFGPWTPGETLSVKGAEKGDACGIGIHIGKTAAHAISYGRFPGRLFSVEGVGNVLGSDGTKFRVGKCRVIAEIQKPEWVTTTEEFIASIKTVEFFKPRRPALKKWKHYPTRAAALDTARAAALDTVRAAARAAAWDTVRAAAWDTAWDTVRAAWDTAWDTVRAAAGDAALEAITRDLDYPEKHKKRLRARWEVFVRGYGLVCDVNGVFYTYGKEPSRLTTGWKGKKPNRSLVRSIRAGEKL